MITTRGRTLRTWRMLGPEAPAVLDVEGRGPGVLVIHGFTGTPSEVLPLARALADAGRAVRAPLLPGHGSCPTLLAAARFDDWLAFARGEAERLAARTGGALVLVGFSLGSLLALSLATELGSAVRAVVALAPPLRLRPAVRWPLEALARAPWVPDLYVRKVLPAEAFHGPGFEPVATYDRDPLRAAVEVARAGRHVLGVLPHLRAPLLVQHGGRDALCPTENAELLAARAGSADVTLRMYTTSGHVLLADGERRAVVADAVAFLDRVAPAG